MAKFCLSDADHFQPQLRGTVFYVSLFSQNWAVEPKVWVKTGSVAQKDHNACSPFILQMWQLFAQKKQVVICCWMRLVMKRNYLEHQFNPNIIWIKRTECFWGLFIIRLLIWGNIIGVKEVLNPPNQESVTTTPGQNICIVNEEVIVYFMPKNDLQNVNCVYIFVSNSHLFCAIYLKVDENQLNSKLQAHILVIRYGQQ